MSKAVLILQDKTILSGKFFGTKKDIAGEVVFNTGMVGYPETLTDPSYRGQILVLTYPLIGNYGVALSSLRGASHSEQQSNPLFSATNNFESEKIQIAGLIVSEYCAQYSHPSAKQSLSQWLKSHGVPAIEGIDTRALTQKLRQKGTMLGIIKSKVKSQKSNLQGKSQKFDDPNERNLAAEVSCQKPIIYEPNNVAIKQCNNILLYDCGVKLNIIRSLLKRGCRVIRVPWNFSISQFPNFPFSQFDGIVISNGPGDPTKCDQTIEQIKKILTIKQCNNVTMPVLGICLGNQILALATGAKTYKLKYGHRGQNQPVSISNLKSQISKPQLKSKNYKLISQPVRRSLGEGGFPNFPISNQNSAYITSQNHGYAVDEKTLKKDWIVWFKNLNDDTVEGIRHKTKPWMAVQFHPESAPGPTDTEWIFDEWLNQVRPYHKPVSSQD